MSKYQNTHTYVQESLFTQNSKKHNFSVPDKNYCDFTRTRLNSKIQQAHLLTDEGKPVGKRPAHLITLFRENHCFLYAILINIREEMFSSL